MFAPAVFGTCGKQGAWLGAKTLLIALEPGSDVAALSGLAPCKQSGGGVLRSAQVEYPGEGGEDLAEFEGA